YLSTALSSSPMARSPFASSKRSSRADMQLPGALGFGRGRRLLHARGAAPVVEPFIEHDRSFALDIIFFESRPDLLEASRVGGLTGLKHCDQTAGLGRNEIAGIAWIQLAHGGFDAGKIGDVRFFFFRLWRSRWRGFRRRSLENRESRNPLGLQSHLGDGLVHGRTDFRRFPNRPRDIAGPRGN